MGLFISPYWNEVLLKLYWIFQQIKNFHWFGACLINVQVLYFHIHSLCCIEIADSWISSWDWDHCSYVPNLLVLYALCQWYDNHGELEFCFCISFIKAFRYSILNTRNKVRMNCILRQAESSAREIKISHLIFPLRIEVFVTICLTLQAAWIYSRYLAATSPTLLSCVQWHNAIRRYIKLM